MYLFEGLNQFDDNIIYQAYCSRYANQENTIKELYYILRFLRMVNINQLLSENDKELCIVKNIVNPMNGPLIGVGGKDKDKDYDLQFTSWGKWLISKIDDSFLNDLLTFICDALFTMTCRGADDDYLIFTNRPQLVGSKSQVLENMMNDENNLFDIEYYMEKYGEGSGSSEYEDESDEEME